MKKRVFGTVCALITLMIILTQSASAITQSVIIKPEYTEDTVLFFSYKDGQIGSDAEYIYTGEKIKPEIVVKKFDGSIADPTEYKVYYDDDCHKTGIHSVEVEYLKNGYKVSSDYSVVPGKTQRVDITVKNGNVTLSWAAVKGATCYRVYKHNASTGSYSEVLWEDGSFSAPFLSRTFSDLEPGKTYDMAIMALASENSMPTKQRKTFKFTVPANKEGTFNIVPGINEPSEDTTKKVTTTTKVTEKKEPTTTLTTKVVTTEATTLPETTLLLKTTSLPETTTPPKTTAQTETKSEIIEATVNTSPKESSNTNIIIPIIVVVITAVVVGVAFVVIKKKKK